MTKLSEKEIKVAFLVATGSAANLAENAVPYPLPGVKLGLANVFTLYAVNNIGFRGALAVATLRPVAASFFSGMLLTPSFAFALFGSLASAFVMSFLKFIPATGIFSNIGLSVAGSISHLLAQVAIFLLFVPPGAVLAILPFILVASVVAGVFTGILSNRIEKSGFGSRASGLLLGELDDVPELSGFGHSSVALFKILSCVAFAIIISQISDIQVLLAVLGICAAVSAVRNFIGLKKSLLAAAPFIAAMFISIATGIIRTPEPFIKLFSFFIFGAAISRPGRNFEMLAGLFSLIKPAEKFGVPVSRAYLILMVCLQSNWSEIIRNAAAGFLGPVTE